jgi:hypothetical protein
MMPPEYFHSPHPLPPTQFGKVKQACAQDIVWGRPVFRAPDLPPPQLAFAPLPPRSQFFTGRSAAAH